MQKPRTDTADTPAVEFRGVSKVFRSPELEAPVVALNDVSFSIPAGQFVSIVGESGCGKSTALKMTAGLLALDAGTIDVRGKTASAGRRDVGIMLQTPALLPWMTVHDNVALPFRIFGERTPQNEEAVRDVLEMVGLTSFANAYPRQLSGGMQQRVSLARLLVYRPAVKLMDEPFGGLDEFNRERLNLELTRIQESGGHTIVFVTHSIAEAVLVSDRIIVMRRNPGRVGGEFSVPLPRPRDSAMIGSPEFGAAIVAVRELLRE